MSNILCNMLGCATALEFIFIAHHIQLESVAINKLPVAATYLSLNYSLPFLLRNDQDSAQFVAQCA